MKTKFIFVIVIFLFCNISFCQLNSKQSINLEKILVDFPIPYKDKKTKFRELKTSDEYFNSASERTKRKNYDLDSTSIYIAIKELQSSIKFNRKSWTSYRNISRLFVIIKRNDLALISIENAIKNSRKEDKESLYSMKNEIISLNK